MTVEYYTENDKDGDIRLCIGTHTIAIVYYDAERCVSPFTEKDAQNFIEMIKNFGEHLFPVSDKDAEKYGTTEEAERLNEMFSEDDDFFETMAKLMVLGSKRE